MSLFDRALNAASDMARTSVANYQRAARRRAVEEQIAQQQATIWWATARIGRLALDASTAGRPLPAHVQPAAAAIRGWEDEIAALRTRLAALDAQLAAAQAAQQAAQQQHGPPPGPPPR